MQFSEVGRRVVGSVEKALRGQHRLTSIERGGVRSRLSREFGFVRENLASHHDANGRISRYAAKFADERGQRVQSSFVALRNAHDRKPVSLRSAKEVGLGWGTFEPDEPTCLAKEFGDHRNPKAVSLTWRCCK